MSEQEEIDSIANDMFGRYWDGTDQRPLWKIEDDFQFRVMGLKAAVAFVRQHREPNWRSVESVINAAFCCAKDAIGNASHLLRLSKGIES